MTAGHRPVLLAETLRAMQPKPGGIYVDGTLGAGGHAAAILDACGPTGRLLGLDRDAQALALATANLAGFDQARLRLTQASFDEIGQCLSAWGVAACDGILLDLGVSSMQLDQGQRGFSFMHDGPLDMRMGQSGPGAAELVADSDQNRLTAIFRDLGEEPLARRYAQAVIEARRQGPIVSTGRLAAVIEASTPAAVRRKSKIHPATRVFQALRLAVNDELGRLERFLAGAPAWLNPGGVLAVISYHSLEDRRVKRSLRAAANPCTCPPDLPRCVCGRRPLFDLPSHKAITPSAVEVAQNPRSRSARLRVAVRTEATT